MLACKPVRSAHSRSREGRSATRSTCRRGRTTSKRAPPCGRSFRWITSRSSATAWSWPRFRWAKTERPATPAASSRSSGLAGTSCAPGTRRRRTPCAKFSRSPPPVPRGLQRANPIVTRVAITGRETAAQSGTDFGHNPAQHKCTTPDKHRCLSEFNGHCRDPSAIASNP